MHVAGRQPLRASISETPVVLFTNERGAKEKAEMNYLGVLSSGALAGAERSEAEPQRSRAAMRESAELAKRLIEEICTRQNIQRGQPTPHADRGTSMSSEPVPFYGPTWESRTHSRPHVGDHNPYSESQFRTMKYRPEFPDRFGCIQYSRALFCQGFFRWYKRSTPPLQLGVAHAGDRALPKECAHPCTAPNRPRQTLFNRFASKDAQTGTATLA